jgi:hypothetical protein
VAALVAADPKYVPSTTVASPRVLSLFGDMRKKELPTVARRLMEEGRLAFKEKDVARARQHFELLLQVLDDPALKSRPEAADLRLLADGFFALTNAPATAAATKPDLPAAPAPAPSSAAASVFRPAVAIQQTLPLWQPPDAMSRARDYSGAIKVLIGIDGRVKSATIERPTHPSYDSRLRQASRQWLYQPATQNGEAVESELVIRIELRKTTSTPTK